MREDVRDKGLESDGYQTLFIGYGLANTKQATSFYVNISIKTPPTITIPEDNTNGQIRSTPQRQPPSPSTSLSKPSPDRSSGNQMLFFLGDLMRAIVPVFPPSELNVVKDGSLRGERSPGELHCAPSEFFMLFDVNKDGLISFEEEIDREEFKKVMNLMRGYNRQGAFKKAGHQTGLKVGSHRENGGVVHYFIGEDGNQRLQLENFVQFLRDLHHERLIELNFHLFDANQDGNLCSDEFLRVMHRREREMAQLTKSGIANTTGQTPKMLFRKEHKKLVKSGEEWMKKTVDSYTAITVSINPHFPLC
ncbi:calcium-binding EF hand family protein [Artemisia annua]|uniref:Calcium-binding EF hand family protein n=1 Tax=Artemisia annua TaxID=35608 RepID=A0A2U1P6L0_ARTAN|nr:calcium-binding EF hand family protein [Artemisia annua]